MFLVLSLRSQYVFTEIFLNDKSFVLFQVPSSSDTSVDSSIIEPPPIVVKVESNFKPIKSPSNMVITMKNYDGTQNLQHISQEHGYETVTDMLLGSEGQILAKTSRRGM